VENSPKSAKFSHKFNIFMVQRFPPSLLKLRGTIRLGGAKKSNKENKIWNVKKRKGECID
jgi:hypothetical protein